MHITLHIYQTNSKRKNDCLATFYEMRAKLHSYQCNEIPYDNRSLEMAIVSSRDMQTFWYSRFTFSGVIDALRLSICSFIESLHINLNVN
jgi:hypothetical protein